MTAKEFLTRPKRMKARLDRKLEKLEELKAVAERCTIQLQHTSGGGNKRSLEDTILRINEAKAEIDEETEAYVELENEIDRLLDNLQTAEAETILKKRYLQGKSWEEISDEMSISEPHIFRLHRKAIQELEEILKDDSK